MLYPSIDKLLNIVDSKYILVHVASIRSKQMLENNHYQMRENEYHNKRTLGRALEEVEAGLIKITNESEKSKKIA
jgi:DNA-directed RNA polymerase subunit omega